MRRVINWLPIALGIALLSSLVALQWHRVIRGQNDFVALYAGGKLVGTPDLYSRSANEGLIKSVLGLTMESVMYTRPPFYAALLKPLTLLPYLAAYGVFFAFCLGSMGWFIFRFSKGCPSLPLYASFCIPLAASLVQGQDAPLLLAVIGASILLTRQKRDFLAGLVLSLCAIKFHLFLLVPLLLLMQKRWRILAGATSGVSVMFALGTIIAGTGSIRQYMNTLRDPWINFSTDMMPNLHGLVSSLHAGEKLEIGLTSALVLTFLWISHKSENYELLLALSLLCSLLVSYHSGIGDDILLLPIFVLILASSMDKPLRFVLAIALTPIPYFTGAPISITTPVLLLAIFVLATASLLRGPDRAVETTPAKPMLRAAL